MVSPGQRVRHVAMTIHRTKEQPRPSASSQLLPVGRLFDLSLDMLGTISFGGFFTLLNPAWERTLGWSLAELKSKPSLSFIHPDDLEKSRVLAAQIRKPGGATVANFENRYRAKDGSFRWIDWTIVAEDEVMYFVARDVTGHKAEEILRGQAISLKDATLESVADGVWVSDHSGHLTYINPAGVRLLGYDSPDRLIGCNAHAVFHHRHLDGTESQVEDCPVAKVRSDGITRHVHEDTFWRRDGQPISVAYSAAAIDLTDGAGSVVAFRDITAMQTERERVHREFGDIARFEEVRDALANDRFAMYAQPIVDARTGEVIKHELLIRMLSASGEVVGPDKFLPAAEKYGLIMDIDRWVFTQAATFAAGGRPVTVNIAASSMGNASMLVHIEREITRTGADPGFLTFEVTETAVMADIQDGKRFADRLVDLGCSFALDDFGTGYGSLTYLRELPIAYLKIDVQFIKNVVRNGEDRRLVEAIVSIAKSLGKKTIAEGVEDAETFALLTDLAIDYGQGYYLGRPAPFSLGGV